MSRFLFLIVEGGGNVPVQLAIARRLVGRGHEVHVLSDRAAAPAVQQAGCTYHPFVCAPHHNMSDRNVDVIRDWDTAWPPEAIRRIGEHVMFGPAAAYARDLLDAAQRVRPDAMAVDCLSFGAILGAEKSGIPSALLVHFPIHPPAPGVTPFGLGLRPAHGTLGRARDRLLLAAMRRLFRFGLSPVNAARRGLQLAPLGDVFDQFHVLARSLVLTSREYDFVPSSLPERVVYVGPQLDDPPWVEPLSVDPADDASAPLVLVSLGSTYQRQDKALESIVKALGALPVRGLVTLGPLDPPTCAIPRNVTVVPSAPHAAVLPRASLVICHGGHGTVTKALAHGLPVIALPFGRDQKDNGARVAERGAGLSLSPTASPARIAGAVRRVLGEARFRDSARRMAAVIARDVKEDRAVAELESLAGGAKTATEVRQTGATVRICLAACDAGHAQARGGHRHRQQLLQRQFLQRAVGHAAGMIGGNASTHADGDAREWRSRTSKESLVGSS